MTYFMISDLVKIEIILNILQKIGNLDIWKQQTDMDKHYTIR